ncbi:MAG: hypothetical protein P1U87_22520, partial [Verrucomicrobiales bacterium]|nr:hypothetical protein [Verrucomicrobiales bacterium]
VLTTFFSIFFAILFLLLFLRVRQNGDSCADQDALIPFRDDELAPPPADPTIRKISNAKNPKHQNDQ